jgi:hypothetical protein
MTFGISHDLKDESIEAKARWFQSLSLSERMDVFWDVVELALTLNPRLAEKGVPKNAQQAPGGVRLLRIPQQQNEEHSNIRTD